MNILNEKQLIPHECSTLDGGTWVVFASHPHDATYGMGGTLIQQIGKNSSVVLVLLTNDRLDNLNEDKNEYLEHVRQKLGVTETIFFDRKVRTLCVDIELINDISNVLKRIKPDAVFFPSPIEYHPDHRVTAWAVWKAQQTVNFQGRLFSYDISTQGFSNLLVDITDVMEAKQEAMPLSSSQNPERICQDIVVAINRSRTHSLPTEVKYAEAFFKYDLRYAQLNKIIELSLFKNYRNVPENHKPLVSILIRTKDRRSKLTRALDSLVNQVYTNIEVVVVNDGGEDITDTLSSYNEMSRFHDIKHTVHRTPQGRPKAANAAMLQASGEYLMFLDDDDEFEPQHINLCVSAAARNPDYKVFYTMAKRIDEDGNHTSTLGQPFDKYLLKVRNYITIHSALFSRKYVVTGYRFDNNFDDLEDWDFWLQLSRDRDFFFVNSSSALYHDGGDSLASSKTPRESDARSAHIRLIEKWSDKYTPTEQLLIRQAATQIQRVTQENQKYNLDISLPRFLEDHFLKDKNVLVVTESNHNHDTSDNIQFLNLEKIKNQKISTTFDCVVIDQADGESLLDSIGLITDRLKDHGRVFYIAEEDSVNHKINTLKAKLLQFSLQCQRQVNVKQNIRLVEFIYTR